MLRDVNRAVNALSLLWCGPFDLAHTVAGPSAVSCGRPFCKELGTRTIVTMSVSLEGFGVVKGKKAHAAADAAAACSLFLLVPALALAAAEIRAELCDVQQPDPLEINWTAPCQDGSWDLDPQSECRLWNWRPAPEDTATWSGACRLRLKEGRGVVQWYEHGRAIDRFEGTYRRGKREGFGRYDWPAGQRYLGTYQDDLPHGQGSVTISDLSLAGTWRRGCLKYGDKRIAIGVPLRRCDDQ